MAKSLVYETKITPATPIGKIGKFWTHYDVELALSGKVAASIPLSPDEIKAMLEHRMATEADLKRRTAAGERITPIAELVQQVIDEGKARVAGEEPGVEVETEEGEEKEKEVKKSWATFKKDEKGLYWECRCVRGHLKDCADQTSLLVKAAYGIKALHSKIANKVFPEPMKMYIVKKSGNGYTAPLQEPDGTEMRFVHAMTPKGKRSSIKMIDYVNEPVLRFRLKVLNDGVITEELLRILLEYGGTHGTGQERGQDWGKYELSRFEELKT